MELGGPDRLQAQPSPPAFNSLLNHPKAQPMGLRLKFNLILVAIVAADFNTVGAIARRYLLR